MSEPISTTFRIEFVDADPQQPDPARTGQVAREAVAALQAAGYDVQPAYTSTLGGREIYELIRMLAEGAQANKEVVLALIASVAAPIAAALAERLKQRAPAPAPSTPPVQLPPPVVVTVEGTRVELHEPQIGPDELLRRLLEADPGLPQRITPRTQVSIRVAVPPQPQHRRR